ncbi:MAG: hypothetical protein FWD26_05005 [Treponema sp.]|nr:hypothetical protein [Treponema sp.]
MKKLLTIIVLSLVVLSLTGCELILDILLSEEYSGGTRIYSGSSGYNVAYRISGNIIYSGSSGFNVAYRVDN